eukprot:scaffold339_cov402-Prasinococcus_capsulatus_cf.AAC.9
MPPWMHCGELWLAWAIWRVQYWLADGGLLCCSLPPRETEGYATLIEKYASQLRRQSDVEGEMTFAQYMEYQFSFKNSATGRFLKRMGQSFEK